MGKSHRNLLEVQKYAQKYYQINGHGFTAPDLAQYMELDCDISEKTVRRCLEEMVGEGFIGKTEVSQTAFYVPDEALLPDPESSDMYSEEDLFW
ncbi:hypothetical protein [Halolamina sp. C58]|uniref:hypothetical protein n=1 Tax=Halolamina sp. C58 TaxID=3421640 RepID=UPI003EBD9A42